MKHYTKWIMAAALFCSSFLLGCKQNDPEPPVDQSDYTMLIYSTVGGKMDYLIEEIWAETQLFLPDKKVRVFCVHKYGKEDGFKGKYGQPGEIVAFELTKDTKFEDVCKEGTIIKDLPLYEPICLTSALDWAAETAPAKQYILTLYGHGGGFDANVDYPREWAKAGDEVYDTYPHVPHKAPQGVLYDEWMVGRQGMNMYELTEAIAASKITHLKGLMFHNCLMGGMESMMEVQPYTDYIIATPFLMTSEDNPLIPMLVKNIRAYPDFETAARHTVIDSKARMINGFQHEDPAYMNGNVELLKSSELQGICKVVRTLSKRICALYPTQQTALDNATNKAYRFYNKKPYFDLLQYAQQLAEQTGDEDLKTIVKQLEQAFTRTILEQVTADMHVLPALPAYSLSIVLVDQSTFEAAIPERDFTYQQVYEHTEFHRLTLWGEWLHMNKQLPTGNPCGQIIE